MECSFSSFSNVASGNCCSEYSKQFMAVSHQLPALRSQRTNAAQKASWEQVALHSVLLSADSDRRGCIPSFTLRFLKTRVALSRCNRGKKTIILDVFSFSTNACFLFRNLQLRDFFVEYSTARQVSSRRQLARHPASSMSFKSL